MPRTTLSASQAPDSTADTAPTRSPRSPRPRSNGVGPVGRPPADKHLVTRHADAAQLDRPGIEPGPAHTLRRQHEQCGRAAPALVLEDQPPAPWGPDMVAEPATLRRLRAATSAPVLMDGRRFHSGDSSYG